MSPDTPDAFESTPNPVPAFDPFADDPTDTAEDAPFAPPLISIKPGEERFFLPLMHLAKGLRAHWWPGSAELQMGSILCTGAAAGCPLCPVMTSVAAARTPNEPTDVIIPVIELGRNEPGYLKMARTTNAGQSGRKPREGVSLYAQIERLRQAHDWTKTALRVTKHADNRFVVSVRPVDGALLPPPALIEKFIAHMQGPIAELFGDFVRFDSPEDLRALPSIQRMLALRCLP